MTALIFDTETTGGEPPQLIEAGGIVMGDAEAINLTVGERFEQRYNPGAPSTLGALMTHHILDSELEGMPPPSDFALPDGTRYLIGHNIDYDWQVIGKPEVKRICTLAIARFVWPSLDCHKLGALCYYVQPEQARELLRAAHSTGGDCEVTRWLLRYLISAIRKHLDPSLESWEDLWGFSELARIPTHMPFGKHKGCPIGELPGDYIDWFLREQRNKPEGDGDPYLLKALRGRAA